ncbi:Gfo/Idh/MocA family oxidoreductase [Herbaspirillum seropedicae]|uniref:Dehydrogenase protein n=1 Tax=Herbaspirillum seropedicae (strain SmR1) TaxID=757424 RepID=D8ITN4_HERSS|nr:Gfo/Idh/MocA family oxidoreductase [Herbaspirillum seropedicae]ADJ65664.1 dehydrogenase protein [Herbaspirillum seropedicae SmR1]AKN67482.1 oxidoreductase [Herbaspirillum seropedicae]NQE32071.1 oxidoreductase [Herbaspirillum seropedicae]UMU23490.1 Gfo/Idh/MocA family oxidoreductase [Herbaspirillum seropedicae]
MNNYPKITDRKIRIGIVGCGRISKNHFGSIEKHADEMELIAICDIDPVTLAEHAEKYNVPAYSTMEEMLEKEQLDLVALCTPSGSHPEQTVLAAKHRIHVMTEKPMATRWKDGVRMVKACDEAGVHLFVVKQNRRNTTLQLLKRAVTEKRFGKIHMVHLNVFWTRPQSYYDQGNGWRGTWEFDGGAFMNQASHYVDLLDWLIGPVEKVQAMMSTTRDIEVEDTGVLNVKWRNGALGSMSVTMLTYPKNLEGSITILGEKGTVRVGGVAVNDIQLWQFEEPRDYDHQIQEANYETTSVYGFGHPLYYKNVIDVMRGLAAPETDGREGLKSLELLIAAYLSARDGTTVSLPLEY